MIGIVGAGFVVGIRMVSEWFPPAQVGTAEGLYGGWGNFGAAAAALALPIVADVVGGPAGWRWAIGLTGVIAALYGLVYLRLVERHPRRGALRPGPYGRPPSRSPAAVRCGAWWPCRCRWPAPSASSPGGVWYVDVISSTVLAVALAGAAVAARHPDHGCAEGRTTAARRNAVPDRRALPVPLGGGALARLHVHLRLRARRRLLPARLLREDVGPLHHRRRCRGLDVRRHEPGVPTHRRPALRRRPEPTAMARRPAARPRCRLPRRLPARLGLAARAGHRHGAAWCRCSPRRATAPSTPSCR